ncbi:hypothetical protein ACFWOL_15470 [Streptomyces sp. NPDC058442]|uniref:hypothetical protein n=1 Tax=Streptomyces sp. NPDC058442 TaxID=3346503 RepID=UPI003650BD44
MNAATATEWLTALAIGTAAFLPIAAATFAAGIDLPNLSRDGMRDTVERARLLLALAQHLETREVH